MQHLLLLHGAIGSKDQLEMLSESLKGGFITHTLNFSGHGGTAMPEQFSIETFASDVLSYLDQHRIEKINIFGYSMGGYVALYLAMHHPARIGKIFTFATKFLWTPEIAAKEIKMLNAEKIADKIPAFAKILEERHAPGDWRAVLHQTAEMMTRMGNKNPLQLSDLSAIGHEVLTGIGDKDTMVSLEETIDVYRGLKNAHLMVVPDTQHPIEKADRKQLTAAILAFM